jgi:proteasome alpha subunit
VEIVVAEVAEAPAEDQIYRITFDGSVNDEHGYVAMGGQAEAIATVLKEHYSEGMSLTGALAAAIAGLTAQANGDQMDTSASQLEVAVLERSRDHRTFRRLTGARLESLLAEAKPGSKAAKPTGADADAKPTGADAEAGAQEPGQPDSAEPGQADSSEPGQAEPGGESAG